MRRSNGILKLITRFVNKETSDRKFEKSYYSLWDKKEVEISKYYYFEHYVLDLLRSDTSQYQPNPELRKQLNGNSDLQHYDGEQLRLRAKLALTKLQSFQNALRKNNKLMIKQFDVFVSAKKFVQKQINGKEFESLFIVAISKYEKRKKLTRRMYALVDAVYNFIPDNNFLNVLRRKTEWEYLDEEQFRKKVKHLLSLSR